MMATNNKTHPEAIVASENLQRKGKSMNALEVKDMQHVNITLDNETLEDLALIAWKQSGIGKEQLPKFSTKYRYMFLQSYPNYLFWTGGFSVFALMDAHDRSKRYALGEKVSELVKPEVY